MNHNRKSTLKLCAHHMAYHHHSIGLSRMIFVLFLYNQITCTIATPSASSSWQHGREGKGVIFYDNPDRIIWVQPFRFNPHPGYVVASLDKTLYDDYLYLVALNKQQNFVDKNLKKSSEILDHLNLLSRCGFLQSQSSHCNEKCADHLIVSA